MKDTVKEQQNHLIESGLMEKDDILLNSLMASYADKKVIWKWGAWRRGEAGTAWKSGPWSIGPWRSGWVFFTKERLIISRGLLNDALIIPYKNIQKLSKCSQYFFPMGIRITYKNPITGESETERFSLTKRNRWLDFLEEKAARSRI